MTENENPYQQMADMWVRAMTAGFDLFTGVSGQAAESPVDPAQLMERANKAHLAAVSSGLRSIGRWSEIANRTYPLACEVMALSASGTVETAQFGKALDDLRASLRELVELPLHESRRLQQELMEVWQPAPPTPAKAPRRKKSGTPRRTAKMKR